MTKGVDMDMQQKTVDWLGFQVTNSVITESVVDDVTTFSIKNVIRPHLQKITEAEEDIIAEFLMARGWTPPPGSRWTKHEFSSQDEKEN